jgi:hypothetical protein
MTVQPNVYVPDHSSPAVELSGTRPSSPRRIEAPSETLVSSSARDAMIALGCDAHQQLWCSTDFSKFPSTATLSTCVSLYMANCSSFLPALHEMSTTRIAPIVLQAMATVGAVYGDNGLKRLAVSLSELTRRAILYAVCH